MGAPVFGSIGTRFSGTTATPAIAAPSSVGTDDIIVVYMQANAATTTITVRPTGFAAVEGSPRTNAGGVAGVTHIEWKRATGADTGTYDFTLSASVGVIARAVRYSGAIKTGNPWDSPTASVDGSPGQPQNAPPVSITTLGPDRLLCYTAMGDNAVAATWTPPLGFAQREASKLEVSDRIQTAAGTTELIHATSSEQFHTLTSWLGALIGIPAPTIHLDDELLLEDVVAPAPAFGSIGTRLGTTTATPAVPVPASVAVDDIIVCYFWLNAGQAITGRPAGFAAAEGSPLTVTGTTGCVLAVEWKRATGADSGTYSFTITSSSFVYARAIRYPGCIKTGSPWDTPIAKADSGGADTGTAPAISITTLGSNRLLVYAAADWGGDSGTWGDPAGFTQREGGASVTNLYVSDKTQAVAGGSGTVQATSTTTTEPMGSWLGALKGPDQLSGAYLQEDSSGLIQLEPFQVFFHDDDLFQEDGTSFILQEDGATLFELEPQVEFATGDTIQQQGAPPTLAVTLKASGAVDLTGTAAASTEVLGAITFAANSHVLVVLHATKSSSGVSYTTLRASASGLTFTEETGASQAVANSAAIRILSAPHAAGGSTTITIDSNGAAVFGIFYAIYEITGHDTVNPIGAFVADAQLTQLDGAYSIPLLSAPTETSIVIAAFGADSTLPSTVDPGIGWTEDIDVPGTGFAGVLQTQRRTDSISRGVAWTDIRAGASGILWSTSAAAVEIREGTLVPLTGQLLTEDSSGGIQLEPGPAASTTPVTGSVATTWAVRAEATKTSASTWNVRAEATKTSASTWAVKGLATGSSANTWAVRQAITKSSASTWNVAAQVTGSSGQIWNVRQAITKSSASTWAVKGLATSSGAQSWAVRQAITGSSASTWNVRQAITGSNGQTWNVRGVVTKSSASTWNVRQAITGSAAESWAVRAQATGSSAQTWGVGGKVTSSSAQTWNVRGIATASAAEAWAVRQAVVASAALGWAVRGAATASSSQIWAVRGVLTSSSAQAWAVRVSATASSVQAWAVRGAVNKTSASTWAVRAWATGTSVQTWGVGGKVTGSSAQTWNVRGIATVSSAQAWAVRGILNSTSAQIWAVRGLVAKTAAETWNVRAIATGSSAQIWSVRALVSKSAAENWSVRGLVVKSAVETWNVRGLAVAQVVTTWNVLSSLVYVPGWIAGRASGTWNIDTVAVGVSGWARSKAAETTWDAEDGNASWNTERPVPSWNREG